ncbi:Mitochondrial acidic protein mam33 [Ceratobasidium sp. 414]|nr:Mitochondrial acidic protein mam33 [Ceratobasidium sp. 414]
MSAFRALRCASTALCRASSPRIASRSLARVATASRIPAARAFGASAPRLSQGETDLSLSQKLHEEIKYELEASKDIPAVPEFLQKFQAGGVWRIEDIEGNDEVAIVRTFGNETIRILFSIADIDAPQDAAFEGAEESEEQEVLNVAPIRCSITISKANQGALAIDALAQDGAIVVDNVSFYKDAKLATDLTSEADWKRRGLYIGPQFDHLDVGVQEEIERFLDERGIGGELAIFVGEYSEYKEQKEYVKWLQSVKLFIDLRINAPVVTTLPCDAAHRPSRPCCPQPIVLPQLKGGCMRSGPSEPLFLRVRAQTARHVTLGRRSGPIVPNRVSLLSSSSLPHALAAALVFILFLSLLHQYLNSMSSAVSIPISGAASNSSTPASSPGRSSGLLIYTRDQLLSLASSPLSQTPPDSAVFDRFPASILRTSGNALSNAAAVEAKPESDNEEPATRPSPADQFELELE